MGRQMPQRDEEFNQIHIVQKYIFAVSGVARIWFKEGHESKVKEFKGDTQNIMKFVQ